VPLLALVQIPDNHLPIRLPLAFSQQRLGQHLGPFGKPNPFFKPIGVHFLPLAENKASWSFASDTARANPSRFRNAGFPYSTEKSQKPY
jgi:hypothetical protein